MRGTFNAWLSLVLVVGAAVLGGAGSAVAQGRDPGDGGSPDTGGGTSRVQVELWVNKGCGASYGVGESLLISARASQSAMVTLRERLSDGTEQVRLTELAVRGGVTTTIQTTVTEPLGPRLLILDGVAGGDRGQAQCGFTVVPASAPRQDDHKCGADLKVKLTVPGEIKSGDALTFTLDVTNTGKEDLVNVNWEVSAEVDKATYEAYQARMGWPNATFIAAADGTAITVDTWYHQYEHGKKVPKTDPHTHYYVKFSGRIDPLKAGKNEQLKLPAKAKDGEKAIPEIKPKPGNDSLEQYGVGARAQGRTDSDACKRIVLATPDNTRYTVK